MNRKLKGKIVEKFGTQYEFSKVVNEHECNISKVVRNRRQLSQDQRRFWAQVLNADEKELFAGGY